MYAMFVIYAMFLLPQLGSYGTRTTDLSFSSRRDFNRLVTEALQKKVSGSRPVRSQLRQTF